MSIDKMNRFIIVVAALVSVATAASLDWRIVGGEDADEGEFPYQISLRAGGSHSCGGSILNSQWVLTAAHCVYGTSASSLSVAVGSNTLNPSGTVYRVKKAIANKGFDFYELKDDVALVQIDGEIEFNDKVQPIPLNTADVGGDEKLTLSGWGRTSYPGNIPNKLQKIVLNSLSVKECTSKLSFIGPFWEKQICTLTRAGEGACHGDSGGPLVYNGAVAGIVSWGNPCAKGYPDVFTRVSSYIDWIEKNMK